MPTAGSYYSTLKSLKDEDDRLCLSWTLDEREFLDISISDLIKNYFNIDNMKLLTQVSEYHVTDPYGTELLRDPLKSYYKHDLSGVDVIAGAGVTSLLLGIAQFAIDNEFQIVNFQNSYTDFGYFVNLHGGKAKTVNKFISETVKSKPTLLFCENPTLLLDDNIDISYLLSILQENKGILVVDESNSNYLAPCDSVIYKICDHDNLIVLRGFSKAYGLGGLRVGLSLASCKLSSQLKKYISPLQCASSSLGIVIQLLNEGDVTKNLRKRIDDCKNQALKVFREQHEINPILANPRLPYIFFDIPNDLKLIKYVESIGIFGKVHPISIQEGANTDLYRVSVPLRQSRLELFKKKLSTG